MDDRGLAGGERALEGRAEVRGLLDRLAMAAEGAGVGGEVGVLQLGAVDARRILALLVHADRAEHAVVDHRDHDVGAVLHGRRELLAVHQEAAVARQRHDHAVGLGDLGRDRRRHAVAHRAAGRRELGLEAAILEEAMQERRVVAGAVGDDRIVRQPLVQPGDHLAHVHRAGQRAGLDVVEILGVAVPSRSPPTSCRRPASSPWPPRRSACMPALIGKVAW